MTEFWDDANPSDPLHILDGPPWVRPVPVPRCWCGRTVSWNGIECAEHDDPPPDDVVADALDGSISRHPSGKARDGGAA